MKTYFYFVRVPGNFGLHDVVYKVAAGGSRKEQTKLTLVQQYCEDCGLYFSKVSDTSDLAVDNLSRSLFGHSIFSRCCIRMVTISIDECYQRIIDDCWSDIENSCIENRAYFHQLNCFGRVFSKVEKSTSKRKTCPPVLRKNLSNNDREQLHVAMIGFGLILAVFLIAARLEGAMLSVMPAWF